MATFKVSENYGTYQGNTSYIIDGNTGNTWRADSSNSAGKYVLVEASETIHVNTVKYSTQQSSEVFKSGTYLQYSKDGSSWTDVGQFNGNTSVTFNVDADCKYLRIYCKSGSGYVSISELDIDYTEAGGGGGSTGESGETTLVPSGIGSDHKYAGVNSSYPLTNLIGQSASASSKYAGVSLTTGSRAETYYFIEFDTSEIPSNAIIKKITARASVYATSTVTSRTQTRQIQLFSGTNAKGSPENWSTTAVYTIDDCGEWTREELKNLRMRVYVQRNTSNTTTSTTTYLRGADVTIEWEVPATPSAKLSVKVQGKYRFAEVVWRKVGGKWEKVDDVKALFDGAENNTNSGYMFNN